MIPKIIHQSWKSDKIPTELESYTSKVKELNPEWSYKLWTDEIMIEYVKREFPDFLKTYENFPENIMRADSFRYLIMYKIGGVYLDLDYEVLKPFDFGQHKVVLPYSRQVKFGDKCDGVGNCFFASEPNHPLWLDAINALTINPLEDNISSNSLEKISYSNSNSIIEAIRPGFLTNVFKTNVLKATGPGFLTNVFKNNSYDGIYSPDKTVYHPRVPRNRKELYEIENNEISLGIHHCAATWLDNSFLGKFKSALAQILRKS